MIVMIDCQFWSWLHEFSGKDDGDDDGNIGQGAVQGWGVNPPAKPIWHNCQSSNNLWGVFKITRCTVQCAEFKLYQLVLKKRFWFKMLFICHLCLTYLSQGALHLWTNNEKDNFALLCKITMHLGGFMWDAASYIPWTTFKTLNIESYLSHAFPTQKCFCHSYVGLPLV